MRFAKAYLAKGGSLEKVKSLLYDGKYPADTVIKTNLEFVSGNWENINTCDLWEERRGDFFYTRMVQRRAMIEGAAFAKQLGDAGAGEWYVKQAEKLSKALEVHWSENRGFIVSGYEGNNLQPIRSGLDIATILAVIQSDTGDSLTFSLTDDRVLATLKPLVESFRAIYRINAITQDDQGRPLGLAIGRYFEDSYDGVRNSRGMSFPLLLPVSKSTSLTQTWIGNPWYLTTAAVAEYLYKVSSAFKAKGVIPVTQRSVSFFRDILGLTQVFPGAVYTRGDAMYDSIHTQLKAVGDSYIRRIMFHSRSGRLPEEYTRDEGKERGAKDLTWSYAAIWTAADARAQLA